MKLQQKHRLIINAVVLLVLFLGLGVSTVTYAGPPHQGADPRPGNGGSSSGGGSGNGGGDGDSSGGGTSNSTCASLVGQVINWGFGGEGGVTTELQSGSWQLSALSATDGNYGFGGLGVGSAILHVNLAPEQQRFTPLIQDAGIYLNCEFPIVANIALIKNDTITPPANIEVSASRSTLEAGQRTTLLIQARNSLPNDITNVVITVLLSPGLRATDVSVSGVDPNSIRMVDTDGGGQVVAINLDKMASRGLKVLRVTVQADDDLAFNAKLKSTTTLFYRESAAHQVILNFSDDAELVPTEDDVEVSTSPSLADDESASAADALAQATEEPTAEPTSEPTAEPTATPLPEPTDEPEEGDDFVPPDDLPTTGEDFIPPPMLPTTGEDLTINMSQLSGGGLSPYLPIAGLTIAGLIFGWQQWQASRRNKNRN